MNQLYIPIKSGTLLIPSGSVSQQDKKHLFIICTDPNPVGEHLLVSISTLRNGCDQTCILQAGEHDFINRESFVDYSRPRIEGGNTLIKGVNDGLLISKPCISEGPFERICAGLLVSPHLPRKHLNFYNKYK